MTPFIEIEQSPPPNALHCEVYDYTCSCGHRWTHSSLWLSDLDQGIRGGTPRPDQYHLPVTSYLQSRCQVPYCYRCVTSALGANWIARNPKPITPISEFRRPTKPSRTSPLKIVVPASDDELLA